MAPEEMAAILRSPNQLCYCVCFFALFVTYFVHNVSRFQDTNYSPRTGQRCLY
jgi:hypothetical protein